MNRKILIIVACIFILSFGLAYSASFSYGTYGYYSSTNYQSGSSATAEKLTNIEYHPIDDNTDDSMNCPPAVPEPATVILFGLGSLGLGLYRKLRRNS